MRGMAKQTARRIASDAQSIGELLRKPLSYRVPPNQRDFSWTSEEIDVLWEDITGAILDGRSEYFLGAIVLSPGRDEKTREIVDGQQRLAALSMIFAAIERTWRSLKDEKRATGVFRDFLESEARRTGDVVPKLSLNEINDPVFQGLVLRNEDIPGNQSNMWPQTNKLLDAAFSRIRQKLEDWLRRFDAAESALLDLEEFLSDKTNVIVIEVGDESDAFVIFETLNDRGLELAVSDLVKNYLFSVADQHIDAFKRHWRDIALLVGSENLTAFLRHYWLSQHSLVRERELYRALRDTVRSSTAARQLMERLRKVADIYAALMNPEHAYWTDFPQEARTYLEAMLLFKVTQFRPVLMAAMETRDPDEVTRLLRMLMVISLRYTVISALGTGNLEKIYSDTALAVRKGAVRGLKATFALLKAAYVDDTRFVADFAQKSFSKSSVTRYMLAEINDHLENDPEHRVAERTGRITLEHILPKNSGKEWKGSLPTGEDPADYVELIGNLTLLEKGKNRGIAAASFADKKRKAFVQSTLALNKEIAQCSNWTVSEILARSQRLAKTAQQVWRVDY